MIGSFTGHRTVSQNRIFKYLRIAGDMNGGDIFEIVRTNYQIVQAVRLLDREKERKAIK